MQLKKRTKSLILLISLLSIGGSPHHLQASQSNASINPKKLIIPTLACAFLNNRLKNLSDTKQSSSLFETIYKLKNNPTTLTQEEKKNLSQYVTQQTLQLSTELPSLKDNKAFQSKQTTYQQLTKLQQQLELLLKTSPSQTIHRPHELLIPADGKCLYTTIALSLLLPELNNTKRFNQSLYELTDLNKPLITPQQLAHNYRDNSYLHSNKSFQEVIHHLLKKINTKPGTWGGPKEIKLIAEKLNINIQEYTPNPDNPQNLIKSDLTQPTTWLSPPKSTICIVHDTPLPQELITSNQDPNLQQAKHYSLQPPQHRHHYRIYYTGDLPQLSKKTSKIKTIKTSPNKKISKPKTKPKTKKTLDTSSASIIFGEPLIPNVPVTEEQINHTLNTLKTYQKKIKQLLEPNFIEVDNLIHKTNFTYSDLNHITQKLLAGLGATFRINLQKQQTLEQNHQQANKELQRTQLAEKIGYYINPKNYQSIRPLNKKQQKNYTQELKKLQDQLQYAKENLLKYQQQLSNLQDNKQQYTNKQRAYNQYINQTNQKITDLDKELKLIKKEQQKTFEEIQRTKLSLRAGYHINPKDYATKKLPSCNAWMKIYPLKKNQRQNYTKQLKRLQKNLPIIASSLELKNLKIKRIQLCLDTGYNISSSTYKKLKPLTPTQKQDSPKRIENLEKTYQKNQNSTKKLSEQISLLQKDIPNYTKQHNTYSYKLYQTQQQITNLNRQITTLQQNKTNYTQKIKRIQLCLASNHHIPSQIFKKLRPLQQEEKDYIPFAIKKFEPTLQHLGNLLDEPKKIQQRLLPILQNLLNYRIKLQLLQPACQLLRKNRQLQQKQANHKSNQSKKTKTKNQRKSANAIDEYLKKQKEEEREILERVRKARLEMERWLKEKLKSEEREVGKILQRRIKERGVLERQRKTLRRQERKARKVKKKLKSLQDLERHERIVEERLERQWRDLEKEEKEVGKRLERQRKTLGRQEREERGVLERIRKDLEREEKERKWEEEESSDEEEREKERVRKQKCLNNEILLKLHHNFYKKNPKENNWKELFLLIDQGGDINLSLSNNCVPRSKYFSKKLDQQHHFYGFTPLHFAAQTLNYQAVLTCLNKGANININTHSNKPDHQYPPITPLYLAAKVPTTNPKDKAKQLRIIDLLVDKGAVVWIPQFGSKEKLQQNVPTIDARYHIEFYLGQEKQRFYKKHQQCANALFDDLDQHIITSPKETSWFSNNNYSQKQQEKNKQHKETLLKQVKKTINYNLHRDTLISHPEKLRYHEVNHHYNQLKTQLKGDFIAILYAIKPFYKPLCQQILQQLENIVQDQQRTLYIHEIAQDEEKTKNAYRAIAQSQYKAEQAIDALQTQIDLIEYQRKLLITFHKTLQQHQITLPTTSNNLQCLGQSDASQKTHLGIINNLYFYIHELQRLQTELQNTHKKLKDLKYEAYQLERERARRMTTDEKVGSGILGGLLGLCTGALLVVAPPLGVAAAVASVGVTKTIGDGIDRDRQRRYNNVTLDTSTYYPNPKAINYPAANLYTNDVKNNLQNTLGKENKLTLAIQSINCRNLHTKNNLNTDQIKTIYKNLINTRITFLEKYLKDIEKQINQFKTTQKGFINHPRSNVQEDEDDDPEDDHEAMQTDLLQHRGTLKALQYLLNHLQRLYNDIHIELITLKLEKNQLDKNLPNLQTYLCPNLHLYAYNRKELQNAQSDLGYQFQSLEQKAQAFQTDIETVQNQTKHLVIEKSPSILKLFELNSNILQSNLSTSIIEINTIQLRSQQLQEIIAYRQTLAQLLGMGACFLTNRITMLLVSTSTGPIGIIITTGINTLIGKSIEDLALNGGDFEGWQDDLCSKETVSQVGKSVVSSLAINIIPLATQKILPNKTLGKLTEKVTTTDSTGTIVSKTAMNITTAFSDNIINIFSGKGVDWAISHLTKNDNTFSNTIPSNDPNNPHYTATHQDQSMGDELLYAFKDACLSGITQSITNLVGDQYTKHQKNNSTKDKPLGRPTLLDTKPPMAL